MNSVTITCTCGEEVSKYVKIVDYLMNIKYDLAPGIPKRSLETDKNIQDIFDILEFKLCCRKELTARITVDEMIGIGT